MSIKKFRSIIRFLTQSRDGAVPVTGIAASDMLRSGETGDASVARNLAASFIAVLSGPDYAGYNDGRRYLDSMLGTAWEAAARFLSDGAVMVESEIRSRYREDGRFRLAMDDLHEAAARGLKTDDEGINRIWRVFFPEGINEGARSAASLREKRTVRITKLNDRPVRHPEREVLFTANALLTVPLSPGDTASLDPEMREAAEAAARDGQSYWYDHPIPVGTPPGRNELVYGLKNLSEALSYEESAGLKDPLRNIECVVSVSVTHRNLRTVARSWIRSLLADGGGLRGINCYLFTEDDTARFIDGVLVPAASRYAAGSDAGELHEIFGVDGEYGRHFSFLKAAARIWSVFVSPEIRAAFKIDLDQVFPQGDLVRETGTTAFGHLCTPLWGAQGEDSDGEAVFLGMIAGSLVNRRDIAVSLFTPDVPYPPSGPKGDEIVFWSAVPQAVSTRAEMMVRYGAAGDHDGAASCIQRIHVTGGTTGILVEALKRYRPFTPSCIGRAEDQAYLLSVLYGPGEGGLLRYAHVPGLVMRHDADIFTDTADAARAGKILGDFVRIMLFSDYARALPWGVARTKDAVDPFTGCFITAIPITIVFLRFALRVLMMFSEDDPEALRFFTDGVKRLALLMEQHRGKDNPMEAVYYSEKRGWDLFYGLLDMVEQGIAAGDPAALELREKARAIIDKTRVD